MDENSIKCKGLSVAQGTFGIEHINLEIKRGYITGLIGKNGSGKTTFLKGLAGILTATNSQVVIEELTYESEEAMIRKIVSVVYDKPNFSLKRSARKLAQEITLFEHRFDMQFFEDNMSLFELELDQKLYTYSEGMIKKFMLIIALARRPLILILDEPTSGVDPVSRIQMLDLIQEFMEDEKHTVLFSTHITSDLDKIADYIILIHEGKILFHKEKEELKEEYKAIGAMPDIEDIMRYTLEEVVL
jgi:ABC-2 type transport system ATP-binding protein